MNRRSFLGALAVVCAAPRALMALEKSAPVRVSTVRTGLPPLKWRPLNEDQAGLVRLMYTRNEILDNMPWKSA